MKKSQKKSWGPPGSQKKSSGGWGACAGRWLLKPAPCLCQRKSPRWPSVWAADKLHSIAMCNFEQSGFCPSGTPSPVFQDDPPSWYGPGRADSLGAAHGRGAWPRLASLAAGDEKLPRLSPPKQGREYGQDRPYRYSSNDINAVQRMVPRHARTPRRSQNGEPQGRWRQAPPRRKFEHKGGYVSVRHRGVMLYGPRLGGEKVFEVAGPAGGVIARAISESSGPIENTLDPPA